MTDKRETLQPDALDVWNLPAEEIDRILATDDDPRLRALFGEDYDELRQLARKATRSVRGHGPLVLFLPGILGSSLGKPGNFFTRDTIWFDPVSIARGDLSELKLASSGRSRIQSLGVIPVVHTYLRLRLRAAGFNVDYYHYDWRQSLAELGRQLADFVENQGSRKVMLVAHSMGGLVSRAALNAGVRNVTRVIMVGTPNRGSFASVEVLQAINSNVTLADRIDLQHTAEELTREVFSTFPTIYEMLPRPEVYSRIDLFKSASWPKEPFRPTARRLQAAAETWPQLTDEDPRLRLIAGYGQETLTDLSANRDGEFNYHFTTNGDGTVPLNFCELPGVPTRYVSATHTGLLRSESVARAVIDLLRTGSTNRLEGAPQSRRSAATRTLRRADFEVKQPQEFLGGRRGHAVSDREAAHMLEAMLSMSTLPVAEAVRNVADERVPAAVSSSPVPVARSGRLTDGISFNRTVMSRDNQSLLEIELYHGSVFDAPLRAIVLGVFENVDPQGPARVLDDLTNGAVTELLNRRMLPGNIGQVFVMPSGRNGLKADYVVFVGLGDYDAFLESSDSILRTVSCNVLRTLMRCGVDEFATLVYGGASGVPVRLAVESFMRGYLDALEAISLADHSMMFRRVTFCEMNDQRYAELKDELFRIGGSELCDNVRLRLHEPDYPATTVVSRVDTPRAAAEREATVDLSYLTVRVEEVRDERDLPAAGQSADATATIGEGESPAATSWILHAALLTSGGKAAVFPSAVEIDRAELDAVVSRLAVSSVDRIGAIGEELMTLLFTDDFRRILDRAALDGTHLAVIHDALGSRIPWEALPLQTVSPSTNEAPRENAAASAAETGAAAKSPFPGLNLGISRRYQTDGENSIARFLEERRHGDTLQVLSIVNPTQDLPGAQQEGQRIREVVGGMNGVALHELWEQAASRDALLRLLASGRFDVVHYAGHAFFDSENRSRSGLICAGDVVLSGRDIAALDKLPSLVFFNACESGRVRSRYGPSRGTRSGEGSTTTDRMEQNVGVAEALLRGGIAQFVGTYWPVGDAPALAFATAFYKSLVIGQTVRQAVVDGRSAVFAAGSVDFADYLHYGSPNFVVKKKSSQPSSL